MALGRYWKIGGFCCLFLLIGVAFVFAGCLLVVDEPPEKVDVIVVLAGDRGNRTQKGVELFRQGYAPQIIMSGAIVYDQTTIAELMKRHALRLGVPEQSVILEPYADSTYENAVYTKKIMHQHDFGSAIIVSSDYHMRRVKYLFTREFRGTGVRLVFCPAQDPAFNPRQWWSSNKSMMTTVSEYIKLAGYALGNNR